VPAAARGSSVILEFAQINLQPGTEARFESVFPTAIALLAASPGYLGHELHRSIETPTRYALLVKWRTLEDHTVGFRGSRAFGEWRAQLAPFLAGAPVVEHFARV
jgi:heme-degrading monooxygenase HmoA